MTEAGLFTQADIKTICRAAALAEMLTTDYFGLTRDEWKKHPYSILTRQHVAKTFHEQDVFASLVKYAPGPAKPASRRADQKYGIILQDPNILLALLRSWEHDLWTMGLFVLTHELVHIIRFSRFGVDFWAGSQDRDREEDRVHAITGELLSGVTKATHLLGHYHKPQGARLTEAQ